jgi:hypothetical protein
MTTAFGSAMLCKRAARFGVSPTMAWLLRSAGPDQVTDDHQPGRNADTRLQDRVALQITYRSDQFQPRAHARSASSS